MENFIFCAVLHVNPFQADILFYTPRKHQNISGLPMFSDGLETKYWLKYFRMLLGNTNIW